MKTICVDDEPLAVEYTLRQCELLPEIDEAKGFTDAVHALDWLGTHPVDLAILDINMPQIDGITIFNPGSVGMGRQSYGLIEVKGEEFQCRRMDV